MCLSHTPVRCILNLLCLLTNESLSVMGITIDLICIKLTTFLFVWCYQTLHFSFDWPFYPPDMFATWMIAYQLFYLFCFYGALLVLVALVLIFSAVLLHPLWLHPYSRNIWTMKLVPIRSFVKHNLDIFCNFRES